MTQQPNSKKPQEQDVYQRIVSDIRSDKLLPGGRLTETDLASRFGIGRTPMREAIRQLETDGLITHTPRRGATIRSLGHAEISDL